VKLEEAIKSTKFKNEVQKAVLNVLYTAWWLKTLMSRELKAYGITHEQYNVLRILKGKHPEQVCVREIASRMIEKNSNVPRIIDRLEAKTLAKRNASQYDKRETAITITQAGIDLLNASAEKLNINFESNVKLENEEALQLNNLLEKLRENENEEGTCLKGNNNENDII
jgi:DNA-binding MarR family transcriptional regulator